MMTARLQGQPVGTYWEDVSIQQSIGVTVVGDALGSQRIWMGDSWLQIQTPMAFRRSGDKWMRQGTPGATVAGGGFDFNGEAEAGLEHYILIQLEAYARMKAGTGTKTGTVGLLADAYGAADEMVLAGLAQWMYETEAGHAAAQDAGLIGAAGGVVYALAKKFHAERLVPSKVKTLIEGAKAKIRALINEFSISDAPVRSAPGNLPRTPGVTHHTRNAGIRDPRDMAAFSSRNQQELLTSLDPELNQITLSHGPRKLSGTRAWVDTPSGNRALLHTHPGVARPQPSEQDLISLQAAYRQFKGGKGTYFEGIVGDGGITYYGFLEGEYFERFRQFLAR